MLIWLKHVNKILACVVVAVQSVMSISLQPHGLQHARLPCPLPSPRACLNWWVSDGIQPTCPLLSPSPPAFNLSQHQGLFQWAGSSHQVVKVLELQPSVLPVNIQDWVPLGLTGLICCSPRDSQESSPVPQFKNPMDGMKKALSIPGAKCQLPTVGVPQTLPLWTPGLKDSSCSVLREAEMACLTVPN